MAPVVVIVGGTGRIGRSVAADLIEHTDALLVLTGREASRRQLGDPTERLRYQALDLDDRQGLQVAIAPADLVIHCAGPFHDRDHRVLAECIDQQVNYIDVSDQRAFTQTALSYHPQAQQAGITAVINAGVFPGLSNSMVRQDVEQLDQADQIHLSYVVAGSGGAGLTVMRTTFLGLQQSFQVWRAGQWQVVAPYSERETVVFPRPYGAVNVFWFEVPETWTLAQSFAVKSVTTKFGSVPELYNLLTWLTARGVPSRWLQRRFVTEFLARASYGCTQLSDRWSGTGVAIQSTVEGALNGQPTQVTSTLVLSDTAKAAGYGVGSIAQLLLTGQLAQPGVSPVETLVTTAQFQEAMQARQVRIRQCVTPMIGKHGPSAGD